MSAAALQLAFFIVEEAIKEGPALYADLQKLCAKADPTAADWAELRAKVAAKTYFDYVPNTALPISTEGS